MSRIVKVKNNGATGGTWVGQTIAIGAYFQIPDENLSVWKTDNQVFTDVGAGTLVVNNGVDGTDDIIDVTKAWGWLTGNTEVYDISTGRITTQQSARPLISGKAFSTVWTSAGDDITTPTLGAGIPLAIETVVGVAESSIIAEFHSNFGDVYLHEGYLMWDNASWGDYIDVEVIAKATNLQQVANLDYELDINRIKFATSGPGTGTHGLAATPVLYPNKDNLGYWDYDGTTLSPSAGIGEYDMSDIDQVVNRFFNKIMVNGTSQTYTLFESSDATKLPTNYYVKLEAYNVSNTIWHVAIIMNLYRERTA